MTTPFMNEYSIMDAVTMTGQAPYRKELSAHHREVADMLHIAECVGAFRCVHHE
jgi:hypothetical protein